MLPPFIYQLGNNNPGDTDAAAGGGGCAHNDCTPDLRYLHGFNDIGGRPEERYGVKGSFTPGVRIVSGGQSRNVPLEEEINHGKVLFVSAALKPDMSGEARTNVIGGRPTERLGSRGSFTPGGRRWLGGSPRDVPLEAEIDHGKVLFVSKTLKPDLSGEARTNQVRPDERLGSRGGFTPGVRIMSGGPSRADGPLEVEFNHGTVLFVSPTLKPDTSDEARTNVVGGRPTERLGSRGSFTPGSKKRWLGGRPRDVPLETEINHGKVIFTSSVLKPNMSDEARTNVVGGRPTERLGAAHGGRFNPGASRRWLGGQPRGVFPAEKRELVDGDNDDDDDDDHPTMTAVYSPPPPPSPPQQVAHVPNKQSHLMFATSTYYADDDDDEEGGYGGYVETELVEGCQQYDSTRREDMAAFENNNHVMKSSSSDVAMSMTKENSGVFRRCGSDSKFSAGADLMSEDLGDHRYPAF